MIETGKTSEVSDRQNLLIPAAIIVAGVLIAGAIYFTSGDRNIRTTPPPASVSGTPGAANAQNLADDDPALGDPSAPVVVVEFSDFECPFCAAAFGVDNAVARQLRSGQPGWEPIYPKLKDQYIRTGQVRFIYRDFPISSIHANAQKAAEAAECADEQGKFWEYHDKIFPNQVSLSVANLKRWAGEIGLDTNRFNECLDSGRMAEEVASDLSAGQAAGVRGTPAYFVNGTVIEGAVSFSDFAATIEAELAKIK